MSNYTTIKCSTHRDRPRGRMQGVCTPSPRDDVRLSNITGILQKKNYFLVVHPSPKKNPGSTPDA